MTMPVIRDAFEVTGIKKKTYAKFFEDVEVGDVLIVTVELTTARRAPTAKITNLRTGQSREDVLSRIGSGLSHLEYKGA